MKREMEKGNRVTGITFEFIFSVILNNLFNELFKRMLAYKAINSKCTIITNFKNLNDSSEIREKSETLRKSYLLDSELSLYNEFVHFYAYCVSRGLQAKSSLDLLKCLCKNNL